MQAYREGSSEFGEVLIDRTSSNHCDEGGNRPTGNVGVCLGRFDGEVEPPQTPSNLPRFLSNSCIKVDLSREGHPDLEKAPKLLQTEILPGNWRVVVMEKAEGPQLRIPVNEQVKMDLLYNLH